MKINIRAILALLLAMAISLSAFTAYAQDFATEGFAAEESAAEESAAEGFAVEAAETEEYVEEAPVFAGTRELTGDEVTVPSHSADEAVIDLTNEELVLPASFGSTVEGYSVNGGKNWKKGTPNIKTLLNKKMTLCVTNAMEGKELGDIIEFPPTAARPKGNIEKLKPFYDDANWELMRKPYKEDGIFYADSPNNALEYALSPDGPWDDSTFLPVRERTEPKTSYYFRIKAGGVNDNGEIIPTGKAFKVTPAPCGAKTKLKPSKKKSGITLKIPKGVCVDGSVYEAAETIEVSVGDIFTIWRPATGPKPRTTYQELEIK